ncbi:lipopolysaccharide biosynthesis protein [Methylocapsa palsarum]|uniref:Membrane protein involved in the export of O-antigen and teichoic acid n=1 Tax=Methylocapsa palsarum TaxID=1612308 RepID=A0A1I4B0S8_9HYPH|nr:hypothetical protein [Methylocapsa palsarum]SFK62512.1 Membrane protein involved in the export of O-antigen and teichoic acid [Methylocapsa palsarum]
MKSNSSLRRVGFSFGAQIYSQIVNVGVQIMLVPILLHAWGAQSYGVWLLLSAVPTYLMFSDFGFTLSAKNEMTIKAAKGDSHGALVTYQSVFVLMAIVGAAVIVLIGAILFFVPLGSIFDLGALPEYQAKLVLFLLSLNVIICQFMGLSSAAIRASGRPATEIAITGTSRLLAGAVIAGFAVLGGSFVLVATMAAVESAAFIVAILLWLRTIAPWLKLGWSHASRQEIARLFHPSVSFMSQTFGQAFMISGPVIVLGMVANPVGVVVFSTSRTLARLGTTATNTIGAAIMPEYSRLFGLGNYALFRRLTFLHFMAALVLAALFYVSLSFLGGWLIAFWTKDQVKLVQPFFGLLMLAVVLEMLWTTLFIPLGAINRHVVTAHAYGLLALLGVIAGYFLAPGYGLNGIVAPLILVNVIMLVTAAVQLAKQSPKIDEAPGVAAIAAVPKLEK